MKIVTPPAIESSPAMRLPVLAVVMLAFSACACSPDPGPAYRPAVEAIPELPGEPSGAPIRFYLAADMRSYIGAAEFAGAMAAIAALDASEPGAFMLSPGDIDPPAAVHGAIQAALDPDGTEPFPWFPVVGNHEAETPSDMAWLRAFDIASHYAVTDFAAGPPGAEETCWSFDIVSGGPRIHIVAINQYYDGGSDTGPSPSDSLSGTVSAPLLEWLDADLAAAEARAPGYILVLGHEPLLPLPDEASGRVRHLGTSLDAHPAEARDFAALLASHGVTAYICGHTHGFSAAVVDGTPQIDAGHARGNADTGAPSTFVVIELYGNFLEATVHRNLALDGRAYAVARIFRLPVREP